MRYAFALLPILLLILLMSAGGSEAAHHGGITDTCITGSSDIAATNLLASYDFHNQRTGKLKDFSPNANDLTLNGGVTPGDAPGQFAKATNFDGSNDLMTGTAPSTPTAFTFAIWSYPNASNNIFVSLDGGTTYLSYGIVSANKYTFSLQTNVGQTTLTTDSTYSTGAWHSVIAVYDGANMALRVDGTTKTTAKTGTPQTWTEWKWGAFTSLLFRYTGLLDESLAFSRSMTDAERTEFEVTSGTCAVPPTVQTNAASEIACISAVLNGNRTSLGSSALITEGFHFGTSPTLTSGVANITVGQVNSTGTFFQFVGSLDITTTYYFRAWANGTDGYAQGSILNFTTIVCPTICGSDPYSNANLWTVGFLIGVAIVLGAMGTIRFRPLLVLSGIAILFIAFYSFCMAGFVPAGLIIPIALFAILEGIPVKDVDG